MRKRTHKPCLGKHLILGLSLTPSLLAAAGPEPGQLQSHPAESRIELPEFVEPTPTSPIEAPADATQARPSSAPRLFSVYVKQIRLVGNSAIPTSELQEITRSYEGRKIDSVELEALRTALTLHYINKGYINSGAVIPDQTVADGVITLQIIEGRLSTIELAGNERINEAYLLPRLSPLEGEAFNIIKAQEQIHILLQNPAIESINARVIPGATPGSAIMAAELKERKPYYASLSFSNDLSPSVGDYKLQLIAGHNNLTGWTDSLQLQAATSGIDTYTEYALDYSAPVNPYDTRLSLHYEQSDSNVIEEPFDLLDLSSRAYGYHAKISHPWYKTRYEELVIGATFEHKHSETTFLGGLPYPLPDADDGVTESSAFRFSQEWTRRQQNDVIAVRSVFNNQHSWLGQFQWAHRLNNEINSQLIIKSDIQLANETLVSMERFSVGGRNSVRGYRKNMLVRDEGFLASIEYRRDFINLTDKGLGKIQFAPFIDFGGAWFKQGDTPDPATIASVGAGLMWRANRDVYAELILSKPLQETDNPDYSIPHSGIHFAVSANIL